MYYKPPTKTKWETLSSFLYESESGRVFGRTGGSWGKARTQREGPDCSAHLGAEPDDKNSFKLEVVPVFANLPFPPRSQDRHVLPNILLHSGVHVRHHAVGVLPDAGRAHTKVAAHRVAHRHESRCAITARVCGIRRGLYYSRLLGQSFQVLGSGPCHRLTTWTARSFGTEARTLRTTSCGRDL